MSEGTKYQENRRAAAERTCRVCCGNVTSFLDLGHQPLSDSFRSPEETADEFFFPLVVGVCDSCGLVQLAEEVSRERMFNDEYPYLSSGSSVMRRHFQETARSFLETELTGSDPFIVEIGCNDGVMLKEISDTGTRHLGVEPSSNVAEIAREAGVRISTEFFEKNTAGRIRGDHGPANVIYAANTVCHIPYLDSIFQGVDELLAPDGVFVFEDPYLGDIVRNTSFDQIYDEHFYLFSASSVSAVAERFGFELVDVEPLLVHGGEMRYTIARPGWRPVSPQVFNQIREEENRGIGTLETLGGFADSVVRTSKDLVRLLGELREVGCTVAAYGATAKSATVTNYCGLGPDLVSGVFDSTPAKQGRLTPGRHIPVRPIEEFEPPYPDYVLLFAWNHADEIMAKEKEFVRSGGKWIMYVPRVRVV